MVVKNGIIVSMKKSSGHLTTIGKADFDRSVDNYYICRPVIESHSTAHLEREGERLTLRDAVPFMFTMKPTPQAARSNLGSNSEAADGGLTAARL